MKFGEISCQVLILRQSSFRHRQDYIVTYIGSKRYMEKRFFGIIYTSTASAFLILSPGVVDLGRHGVDGCVDLGPFFSAVPWKNMKSHCSDVCTWIIEEILIVRKSV